MPYKSVHIDYTDWHHEGFSEPRNKAIIENGTRICFKLGKREIPLMTLTLPLFLFSQDLMAAAWACKRIKYLFYRALFRLYFLDTQENERYSLRRFHLDFWFVRRKRKNAKMIAESAIGRSLRNEFMGGTATKV